MYAWNLWSLLLILHVLEKLVFFGWSRSTALIPRSEPYIVRLVVTAFKLAK